jgi:hypothetical protein
MVFGAVDKHAGGVAQADLVQAIYERFTGAFFDETAERSIGHVGYFGYFGEGYLFVVVGVHVFKHLFNAPAVVVEAFRC